MRDPLDELESFTTPGLTMDPLPASEVRRRGTRMRRRNNALAVVGGVAAVAIIATPLALAANGSHRTRPPAPPVATQHFPTQILTIPAGLDLGEGMGDGSTEPRQIRSASQLADLHLELCGRTVWRASTPDVTEVRSVELVDQGSEGGHQRTLVAYDGVRSADAALAAISSAAAACTGVQAGPPAYQIFVGAQELGRLPGTSYVQAFRDQAGPTGEGYVVSVVQEANLLLLDAASTMGAGDPQVRRDGVDNLRQRDRAVLDAIASDTEG